MNCISKDPYCCCKCVQVLLIDLFVSSLRGCLSVRNLPGVWKTWHDCSNDRTLQKKHFSRTESENVRLRPFSQWRPTVVSQFHVGCIYKKCGFIVIYISLGSIKFVISTLRYTCAQLLCVILQRLKLKLITGG